MQYKNSLCCNLFIYPPNMLHIRFTLSAMKFLMKAQFCTFGLMTRQFKMFLPQNTQWHLCKWIHFSPIVWLTATWQSLCQQSLHSKNYHEWRACIKFAKSHFFQLANNKIIPSTNSEYLNSPNYTLVLQNRMFLKTITYYLCGKISVGYSRRIRISNVDSI